MIGATALYLMFGWLLSAIIAQDLSDRKGYGERPGLATGLLLSALGAVSWLFVPPKRGSLWTRHVHILDLITACAALVLIGSLFMPWYADSGHFFKELSFYDLLVPIGAALAYAQLHVRAGAHETPGLPMTALGGAAVALLSTIVALVTMPSGESADWGAYLSLVAALATTGLAAASTRVERESLAAGEAASVAEARRVGAETS